jgi:hypothetical protein
MRIEQREARRVGTQGRVYNQKVRAPTHHHRIGNASLCVDTGTTQLDLSSCATSTHHRRPLATLLLFDDIREIGDLVF